MMKTALRDHIVFMKGNKGSHTAAMRSNPRVSRETHHSTDLGGRRKGRDDPIAFVWPQLDPLHVDKSDQEPVQ